MNWRHQAACRDHDPELWFSGKPYEQAAALAVCRQCPVVDEWRAFADTEYRHYLTLMDPKETRPC